MPYRRAGKIPGRADLRGHGGDFSACSPRGAAAEPPPETTKIRVHHSLSLCLAPQYVAEELLRARDSPRCTTSRPRGGGGSTKVSASGEADISMEFAPMPIMHVDAGDPIVVLGGVPCRLLRAVRDRAGARHPRPEGEDRRRVRAGSIAAPLPRQHGGICRPGPQQGHQLGRASPRPKRCSSSPRARSMP